MLSTLAPDDVAGQLREAVREFENRFGRRATHAAVAPGRVNLIGEHTDYNDGFVLPMAIARQTLLVAAASDAGPRVRVASTGEDEPGEFSADASLAPGDPGWTNYVRGVVAGFLRRGIGVPGFDGLVASTVPLGSGLSSSAALEVATATLLESLTGETLPPIEKALLCQKAEHEFPRVPCGIMDQSISVMGQADHAMLLDCRTLERRMVPLADPNVTVLIANTNVKHELTGGEYAQRRRECEEAALVLGAKALRDVSMFELDRCKGDLGDTVYRRARHVVTEIGRALRAADAAEAADWAGFGRLMFASHASLRDDFEVSVRELDTLVELARELVPGGAVLGARMTGGGFGGCTVSLVRTDAVDAVTRHLAEGYRRATGLDATIFATRPAEGARALRVAA